VVLIGNSRGGNAIRNYIQNGGGATSAVSHAILGGTPNHGVWSIQGFPRGQ
jgi:triacylglycerol lipase